MVVLWRLWLSSVVFALAGGKEAAAEGWLSSLSGLAWRRRLSPAGPRAVEMSTAPRRAPLRGGVPWASNCPRLSSHFVEHRAFFKLSLASCICLYFKAMLLCSEFVSSHT